MRGDRVARVLAVVALACAALGYGLEWFRQRGTCEFGDNSPDTLVLSVLLILLGGGVLGIVALGVGIVGSVRHGVRSRRVAILAASAAVVSAALLFAFSGGGPGSWFQYCAT